MMKEKLRQKMQEEGGRSAGHHGSGCSGYSYANPLLGMRCRAAKQTMAVEPESLAFSLPGPERHVGQGADTDGRLLQHLEARLQGGAPGGDREQGQDGEGKSEERRNEKQQGKKRERERGRTMRKRRKKRNTRDGKLENRARKVENSNSKCK